MNIITKAVKRCKEKGFWDTAGYSLNITAGLIDYHFNPFAKKTNNIFPPDYEKIKKDLKIGGIEVISYKIDLQHFYKWLKEAAFPKEYVELYGDLFLEKALEHYVGAQILRLRKEDIFIDVAAAESPWFEIAERMYGCTSYSLDIYYPSGIDGKKIGADATAMPVADRFVTKMALHCAYEMFESDSDIKFLFEAQRVLNNVGKVVILPLYLHNTYLIESSVFSDRRRVDYHDAKRAWRDQASSCVKFARHYSVNAFLNRVVNNLNALKVRIYYVENQKEVDEKCYLKFAALLEKV